MWTVDHWCDRLVERPTEAVRDQFESATVWTTQDQIHAFAMRDEAVAWMIDRAKFGVEKALTAVRTAERRLRKLQKRHGVAAEAPRRYA